MTEEWWKIEEILAANSRGEQPFAPTTLDLSLPLASLSGGELTKLFLAIGLSQKPDLLLLDEPTNHMDLLALENLRHFLLEFEGAFVIVSHKPFFLDMVVNITWELTPDRVNNFQTLKRWHSFASVVKFSLFLYRCVHSEGAVATGLALRVYIQKIIFTNHLGSRYIT